MIDYDAGYRDGTSSLIADIRHQFGDGARSMGELLEFFRVLTGDRELEWPGGGAGTSWLTIGSGGTGAAVTRGCGPGGNGSGAINSNSIGNGGGSGR